MDKIASPQDLQAELRRLAVYCGGTEHPRRAMLAAELHSLGDRVFEGAQDLSKLPGFGALKGLTPEQQRQVVQKAQRAVQKDLEKGRKELEQSAKGLWKNIRDGQ